MEPLGQSLSVYMDLGRNGRQLKAEAMLRRVTRVAKKAASDEQAFAKYTG